MRCEQFTVKVIEYGTVQKRLLKTVSLVDIAYVY